MVWRGTWRKGLVSKILRQALTWKRNQERGVSVPYYCFVLKFTKRGVLECKIAAVL